MEELGSGSIESLRSLKLKWSNSGGEETAENESENKGLGAFRREDCKKSGRSSTGFFPFVGVNGAHQTVEETDLRNAEHLHFLRCGVSHS